MSFLMIQPVEEDGYPSSLDGRIRFHFDRSLCEPGTTYLIKAEGPRLCLVALATEQEVGLFARPALVAATFPLN